ncbi:MAG TPA: glycosyltransferase family 4 protein [Magnetospirillum sp.]|nr:glycosyltransferase family 4 protein [Magnetospirillum sp.]
MYGPVFSAAAGWANGWAPAVAAGLAVVVLTRRVVDYLKRRQILDRPNDRSSHTLPTPRGGGLATTPVLAAILMALGWHISSARLGVLGLGALVLLAVSWLDDRKGLPALPRFLAHAAMVALFLILAGGDLPVFGGVLPLWADRLAAGVAWLWFVNLYNFMDGIDGITGVETTSLGLGIAVVATLAEGLAVFDVIPAGLAAAAVGAGFLVWNWHPAKVFLGDSGSVPFGYVLGGLLLVLAMQGQLAAALILPGYYVADATITLGRRALNGEKVWQAHRKHFYQRAVQGGKRHDQVALAILAGNVALVGAAVLAAAGQAWLGVAAGAAVVAGLLALLQRWAARRD